MVVQEVIQEREKAAQAAEQEGNVRDPFWVGVEAALRRASYKARRRAIALNGYVATYRDGKIVYDTEP